MCGIRLTYRHSCRCRYGQVGERGSIRMGGNQTELSQTPQGEGRVVVGSTLVPDSSERRLRCYQLGRLVCSHEQVYP
jgi:hypothetical protein